MLTMLVPLAVFGLFASLALLVFGKLFSSADSPEKKPISKWWLVGIVLLLGLYLIGSSKPVTEQERLDRDAQRLIRQHAQEVDRDMHDLKVRIRAEQMLQGR